MIIINSRKESPEYWSNESYQLLEKYHYDFQKFCLESLHQNFYTYIIKKVELFPAFFQGCEWGIGQLFNDFKNQYIVNGRMDTELLREIIKNQAVDKQLTFEEVMCEFPLSYSFFLINQSYHDGTLLAFELNPADLDYFIKGTCLAAHVMAYTIFQVFRYEIFQDLTFHRFMRDFHSDNKILNLPHFLKSIICSRLDKFDSKIIMSIKN
jgi:hypothetical protein